MKIIPIGDSHSRPLWYYVRNEDSHVEKRLVPMAIANRRYDWLAQLIIEEIKLSDPGEEIVILDIGDFADMKSLSSYDKGKRPAENERIQLDLDYARDARRRLTQPVLEYLNARRRNRKRVPKVRWVALLGNHEHRWERLKKDEPLWDIFDGGVDDLSNATDWGWEVYPFLQPVNVGGINFCHYFPDKGIDRKAIAGVTPARNLILRLHESCAVGHNHEFHIHREVTPLSTKIGLCVGCYMETDEEYAGLHGNIRWWRGIVVLDDVKDGVFDERKIPLNIIRKKFWKPEQGPYDLRDLGLHPNDIRLTAERIL